MPLFALAFLTGILTCIHCSMRLPLSLSLPWLMILVISMTNKRFKRLRLQGLLLGLSSGFLWADLSGQLYLDSTGLPKQLNYPVTVIGRIASLPERYPRYSRFMFDVETMKHYPHWRHKVLISWYRHDHKKLQLGDRWLLVVRLKAPHGLANPGGFDYARWLLQQGISATGYVLLHHRQTWLEGASSLAWIDRLRQTISNQFNQRTDPVQGILNALTIGERNRITQAQWDLFRRTGTSHLIAISGLHIGLIASFAFFFGRYLWRFLFYYKHHVTQQQFSAGCALLAAFIYSGLSGFSIPTQRAFLMITVAMIAILLRRHTSPAHHLFTALLFVLVYDPFAVLSVGFWLSFSAVALLIYVARIRYKQRWKSWIQAQLAITVGLIGINLYCFQQISLVGCLANLIAIPWVSFFVVPLSLMAAVVSLFSFYYANLILSTASYLLNGLLELLQYLSSGSYVIYQHPSPSLFALILHLFGTLLLLAPIPCRYLGWFGLLPLITPPALLPYKQLEMTVLDVGQGLACVLRTRHHTLVYDTGPFLHYDTGRSILLPFLKTQAIKKIDTLVVSHNDNDHSGGAGTLLAHLPVDYFYTSDPSHFKPWSPKLCLAKLSWHWDGIDFEFIHPEPNQRHHDNNSSCVLRVSAGEHHLLLTGDIEQASERYLVVHQRNQLPAELLIAPHHGSKTSSSIPFVQAVNPQWVIFSTGFRNRYHFPHQSIVQRYKNSHQLNTATAGAIFIHFDYHGAVVRSYRADHPVFWQGN